MIGTLTSSPACISTRHARGTSSLGVPGLHVTRACLSKEHLIFNGADVGVASPLYLNSHRTTRYCVYTTVGYKCLRSAPSLAGSFTRRPAALGPTSSSRKWNAAKAASSTSGLRRNAARTSRSFTSSLYAEKKQFSQPNTRMFAKVLCGYLQQTYRNLLQQRSQWFSQKPTVKLSNVAPNRQKIKHNFYSPTHHQAAIYTTIRKRRYLLSITLGAL